MEPSARRKKTPPRRGLNRPQGYCCNRVFGACWRPFNCRSILPVVRMSSPIQPINSLIRLPLLVESSDYERPRW
jgi:hypothetical protein